MTTDALTPAAQITALKDLLQSEGWQLYRDLIMQEIVGDFEEHITRAMDHENSAIAIERMRQVAAIRKAGLKWLKLPQQRIDALTADVRHRDEVSHNQGRRPAGL